MNITHLEPIIVHVNHRGDWIFVRVHTDAGIVGLGEASHSGNDGLVIAMLQSLGERLAGQDARNIEARVQQMRRLATLGGRIGATALSAIEQALWDALGQQLGVPIHALLGGALRNRLRLYANINRHVRDRSPEGFARAASQAVAEGFTAIKMAPFDEVRASDGVRTGLNAAWQAGVERVRAVREEIGDAVELAVDCHSRFDAGEALLVAEELRTLDLFWFEEPVHHRFVDDLARITQAVPMMTASAESLFGMEEFAPFPAPARRRRADAGCKARRRPARNQENCRGGPNQQAADCAAPARRPRGDGRQRPRLQHAGQFLQAGARLGRS